LSTKQKIKYIRSLKQKKHRNKNGVFVIEGIKLVNEAIHDLPNRIQEVYFTTDLKDKIAIDSLPANCSLFEVTANEIERISTHATPQGVLAVIIQALPILPQFEAMNDLLVILDKIRDPGNLGTIIRLADWFGIDKIICSPDTADCYNPKVVQSSMGSIFRVNIHYTDLRKFLEELKQRTRFIVYGTTLEGDNLYTATLCKPSAVIFGNEANGISKELFSLIDQELLIPNFSINPKIIESLNVSTAASIIFAEFRRQTSVGYSK
jgi:TrmH family RNA methyltransferase